MAVNSYDPVNGSPLFSDSDAPDIKVDPRAAAIYAADVGNRIVRDNFAALDAYSFKREGLRGYAKDTNREYVHDGSSWLPAIDGFFLIQRIPFASATTVSFTGFSSQFSNYQAVLDINTTSVASGGTLRMRSGATDDSSAQYSAQQDWDGGTVHQAVANASLTYFPWVPIPGSEHSGIIEFFGPALARPTRVSFAVQTWQAPTGAISSRVSGRHNVSSAFDGFSFTPSSGTVTGTLSVYGRA